MAHDMKSIKFKVNPLLLGLALAYIILAIEQMNNEVMLSNSIYLTIACVSMQLTIIDMIKKLYYSFGTINACVKSYSSQNIPVKNKMHKLIHFSDTLLKVMKYVIFLGYMMVAFFLISFPFKIIPNDFATNKLIGVTTIITFALMIISMVLDEYFNYILDDFLKERK